MNKTTYGVPALLSFVVPGLGQLIKGHIAAAIGFWVAFVILFSVDFPGRLLVLIFLYIANVYNAYNYPRSVDVKKDSIN